MINENDIVVVDEFKFGDNDNFVVIVVVLVDVDLLLIVLDIDVLYNVDLCCDFIVVVILYVVEIMF